MTIAIAPSLVEQIKEQVTLYSYHPDFQAGKRCACPLREDSTNPTSFYVNEKGTWFYCHSCRQTGDIFTFVERFEHCSFKKALEVLAAHAGLEYSPHDDIQYPRKLAARKALKRAIDIWHYRLMEDEKLIAYLIDRGVTREIIESERMGYADGQGQIGSALIHEGFTKQEIEDAGLIIRPKGKPEYDFYKDRFVFPYYVDGEPVYSIGRLNDEKYSHIPENDRPGKYIKHKQTDYIKHTIYGQDNLLQRNKSNIILLTEGVFDYWAAINMGYNAVSANASNFSSEQIKRLIPVLRNIPNVYICFDIDAKSKTGQVSSEKLAANLLKNGIKANIIRLVPPQGWMPDSFDLADHYKESGIRLELDDAISYENLAIGRIQSVIDLEDFLRPMMPHLSAANLEAIKVKVCNGENDITKGIFTALAKSIDNKSEIEICDEIIDGRDLICDSGLGFFEFDGNIWNPIDDMSIRKTAMDILDRKATSKIVKNACDLVATKVHISCIGDGSISFNNEEHRKKYIPLRNCFFDLEKWETTESIREAYFTFKVDIEYDKTAECPRWMHFIKEVTAGDQYMEDLLQEVFGYCFLPDNRFQKFFVFMGGGANGKTRYLEVLQDILGKSCASVPLSMLDKSFILYDLFGKLANITTEDKNDLIKSTANLKSIVSGDLIRAERKYKDSFMFKPYCKMITAMNEVPKIKDFTHGFYRRIEIIEWLVKFVDSDAGIGLEPPYVMKKDLTLGDQFKRELPGIFNWGLLGLQRILKNGKFTRSQKHIHNQYEFMIASDYTLSFYVQMLEEKIYYIGDEVNKSTFYLAYRVWCEENGNKAFSSSQFFRSMKEKKLIPVNDLRRREDGATIRFIRLQEAKLP